jgi:DNA gyrase subunit A
LTVCQNGYGKRTPFGPNSAEAFDEGAEGEGPEGEVADEEIVDDTPPETPDANGDDGGEGDEENSASGARYRTQRRGGKGLRDIKTTERNGPVIGVCRVDDTDEVMMMTAGGKIQRIRAADVSVIGRNTQGVRIMTLDEEDNLAAVVRVPRDEEEPAAIAPPAST